MKPLKIIFAGTPAFAATALQALLNTEHQIVAVYTQADKPAGRGLKLLASAVKELALQHELPIYQPSTLKSAEAQAQTASFNADVMVVAAYGMILPAAVLAMPKFGCLNIHSSLLPRWRGAAPIQRAIEAGDTETGITIMQMDAGLDTGPILLQHPCVITQDDTAQTLHDKLAEIGAHCIVNALAQLGAGQLNPIQQDERLVTYAHKINKVEAEINWQMPAKAIVDKVRAFNPWPVAFVRWQGEPLRIWQASYINNHNNIDLPSGTIVKADQTSIDIVTNDGIVQLLTVQLPGKKIMQCKDFYNAKHKHLLIDSLFN